jgi:hypothetical protein
MIRYKTIQRYSGRIGNLSGRALSGISSVERQITEADKKYTAGVAGELYKLTPLKSFYESTIQPTKTGLKFVKQVATAIETGKPQYAIKGTFDLFDKYDPILKLPNMDVNPFYRVAQSSYLSKYKSY